MSVFESLPSVGEKRARALTKKFVTLENLANAQESEIAECLRLRANDAAQILAEAKKLFSEQAERKQGQMRSLKESGTTKEIAAHKQYISSLADLANGEDD